MSKNIDFKISYDFAKIPANELFKLRVMLTAEGESSLQSDVPRRPLNIALVLDRSGSMGGRKLTHVKQAVLAVVAQLDSEDMVSLTVFDDRIDVVIPPTRVGDIKHVARALEEITARGCTNLYGGYRKGCDLLREHAVSGCLSRVLLLTDGLANRGETNASAFADFAGQMQEQGITTTTIGVGDGYNEFLLGKIAENGGGGAYFIENPEDAEAVFSEELSCLKKLTATDLKVKISPQTNGVQFLQLNTYRHFANNEFLVGDVYSGQPKKIVFEVQVPPCGLGEAVQLAEFEISWMPFGQNLSEAETMTCPVTVDVVDKRAFSKIRPDRQVTLEAAFLAIARANSKAIELGDQGQFEDAAKMLLEIAEKLAAMDLKDDGLNREIADMKVRAERLRNERERFYNERERKRMYHEFDMSSKSRRSSMDIMKMRRELDADPHGREASFRYPCYQVDGHVLAEIDNDRVLLDTGGPFSFGLDTCLQLGGINFPLKRDFMGMDIQGISRLIGTRISALIGSDILSKFNFTIDLDEGLFASAPSRLNGSQGVLDFTTSKSIPVVTVDIGENSLPVFFDTGARISYLARSFFKNYPVTGVEADFYPGLGEFETEVTKIPVNMAGFTMNMTFGVLPKELEHMVALAGVQGILGSEFLNQYRLRYLGPKKKIELRSFGD